MLNGTSANNSVTLTVDASSPLATVGNAALVQASAGSFLVARTAQDTFAALTAVCTHQGCIITGYQSSTYGCPCHGSEFSTTGAVKNGPAASPLRQFTTQLVNNVLTISLS
jgi:cytochrome b6-f complex iron-sulfur subunit